MIERGPDGAGVWIGDDGRIGFGHRRLAILDLSAAGAQPMHSADGTLVVSFNGEIYNYPELRRRARARRRRVPLPFRHRGAAAPISPSRSAMVGRLRGMFARAVGRAGAQPAARARPHGIKPLYYADDGGTLRFASQVSALLAGEGVDTRPNPRGGQFLLWGPGSGTVLLYRGIRLLPAGSTPR